MTWRLALIVMLNVVLNTALVWLVWQLVMSRKPAGGQAGDCEWWHSAWHLKLAGDLQRLCQQVRQLEEHFSQLKKNKQRLTK